jgi:hypothetical protein
MVKRKNAKYKREGMMYRRYREKEKQNAQTNQSRLE